VARRFLIAAIGLCSCHPTNDPTPAKQAAAETAPAPLPPDNASDFLKGNLLQVPRHGDVLWNGMPTQNSVVTDYLMRVSHLPTDAGGVVVEIEPDTTRDRAAWIRRQVIDSGLCRQHRCFEAGWQEKRPVIN